MNAKSRNNATALTSYAVSIHRLALLESSYQKTVAGNMIVPMPVDVKNAQKIIKQYHYRLLFNERAIYEYQKKLVQLRQMFTQNQHWYQVLEMIKFELTDDDKDVEQFRWLTDQQQVALRNFQHCNSIVQAELQLKIHLLTAEEGVLRQFLSANGHVP
ncbi:MAG: hypothetical protein EOO88_45455 [Pedobacter sp.]|nr:MAG: hypothetical protein EOO88_45455 [Pedobacter sp.]